MPAEVTKKVLVPCNRSLVQDSCGTQQFWVPRARTLVRDLSRTARYEVRCKKEPREAKGSEAATKCS